MLNPTPPEQLIDSQGRPTFLWDCDLTMEELQERLDSPDIEVRGYWMGTVMRQARPDDALTLIPAKRMRAEWSSLERYLGQTRPFWSWYLSMTAAEGAGGPDV